MPYQAKDELVLSRQLKVQELAIPLSSLANVVPTSKVVRSGIPSLLFTNFEGVSGLTVASGAFDTVAEAAAVTLAAANDITGVFSLLLRINEPIQEIVTAEIHRSGANEIISATYPTGAANGITLLGNKMIFNFDSTVNFATTNYNAVLVVRYIVDESA